jgi:hypothetical protein
MRDGVPVIAKAESWWETEDDPTPTELFSEETLELKAGPLPADHFRLESFDIKIGAESNRPTAWIILYACLAFAGAVFFKYCSRRTSKRHALVPREETVCLPR